MYAEIFQPADFPCLAREGRDFMTTPEFKFYCPHCDQPLKCETHFAGRQIQCPGCQHLIRIPAPSPGTGFTHVQPESGHTWDTFITEGRKA
jgi:hypothetical protein